MSLRLPSYRCKKVGSRKYAAVSLPDGLGKRRDILLGRYGTRESRIEYARVIADWQASDRRLPQWVAATDITINEMLERYVPFAERHYRHSDGSPTTELGEVKVCLRPLRQLFGHTLASAFGPLSLKALRNYLIRQPVTCTVKIVDPKTGQAIWQEKILRVGLARRVVNQRISRVRRVFRWAVYEE